MYENSLLFFFLSAFKTFFSDRSHRLFFIVLKPRPISSSSVHHPISSSSIHQTGELAAACVTSGPPPIMMSLFNEDEWMSDGWMDDRTSLI